MFIAIQVRATSAMPGAERLILGIESSCDDTGAAVISSQGQVLGEALVGQADIHAPWGGVVPSLARDAHQAAIDQVVEDALADSGKCMEDLDAIAVTVGPGLSMCLKVRSCMMSVHCGEGVCLSVCVCVCVGGGGGGGGGG